MFSSTYEPFQTKAHVLSFNFSLRCPTELLRHAPHFQTTIIIFFIFMM